MRKIKSLLPVILVLSFVLAGCSAGPLQATITPPDKVVKNFLDHVKASDLDKAALIIYEDGAEAFIEDVSGEDDGGPGPDAIRVAFSRLSYEIGEPTTDGDTATVPVTITAVDMPKVFGEAIATAFEAIFEHLFDDDYSEDETNKLLEETLVEGLKNPAAGMVTKNLVIPLKKVEDIWRILYDDESGLDIANAVTGGLMDALLDFGEAFE